MLDQLSTSNEDGKRRFFVFCDHLGRRFTVACETRSHCQTFPTFTQAMIHAQAVRGKDTTLEILNESGEVIFKFSSDGYF